MLGNRRGEVVTIAVVGLCILTALIGLFSAPIVGKILPFMSNNQKVVNNKTVESKPVWIKNPDGSSTMVQTTTTCENNSVAPVPLTFFQKVQNLGILGMVLVFLGIFFPPFGALMMFLIKKAKEKIAAWSVKHEELTADAKKIVWSIDEGLGTMDANIKAANSMSDGTTDPVVKAQYTAIAKALLDMKQDFLQALSKEQDSTTKLLVSQLKND